MEHSHVNPHGAFSVERHYKTRVVVRCGRRHLEIEPLPVLTYSADLAPTILPTAVHTLQRHVCLIHISFQINIARHRRCLDNSNAPLVQSEIADAIAGCADYLLRVCAIECLSAVMLVNSTADRSPHAAHSYRSISQGYRFAINPKVAEACRTVERAQSDLTFHQRIAIVRIFINVCSIKENGECGSREIHPQAVPFRRIERRGNISYRLPVMIVLADNHLMVVRIEAYLISPESVRAIAGIGDIYYKSGYRARTVHADICRYRPFLHFAALINSLGKALGGCPHHIVLNNPVIIIASEIINISRQSAECYLTAVNLQIAETCRTVVAPEADVSFRQRISRILIIVYLLVIDKYRDLCAVKIDAQSVPLCRAELHRHLGDRLPVILVLTHNQLMVAGVEAYLIAVEGVSSICSATYIEYETGYGISPVNAHIHLNRRFTELTAVIDNLTETIRVQPQHVTLEAPLVVVRRKTTDLSERRLLETLTEYTLIIQTSVYLMVHILSPGSIYQLRNCAFHLCGIHRNAALRRESQRHDKRKQHNKTFSHKRLFCLTINTR